MYKKDNKFNNIVSGIAISLGCICAGGTTFAADMTADGVTVEKGTLQYAASQSIGSNNTFLNFDNVKPLEDKVTQTTSYLQLSDVDVNNTPIISYIKGYGSDGYSDYTPFGYIVDSTGNVFKSEKTKTEGYNAIIVKIYNPDTGEYDTHLSCSDSGQAAGNTYFDQNSIVNNANNVLKNPNVINELQKAYAEGGSVAVKKLMGKYLPQIYLAKVDNLQDIIDAENTDSNINKYIDSITSENMEYLPSVYRTVVKTESSSSGSGSSSNSYSYDSVKMEKEAVWRPDDRAEAYKQGNILADGFDGGKIETSSGLFGVDENGEGFTQSDVEEDGVEHSKQTDPLYWLFSKIYNSTDQTGDKTWFSPITGYPGISIDNVDSEETIGLNNTKTVISVKDLSTGAGSVIDLSYINTNGDNPLVLQDNGYGDIETGFEYKDSDNKWNPAYVKLSRILIGENATLGQNTTFRLGVYGSIIKTPTTSSNGRTNDSVYIVNANQAQEEIDVGEKTNLNVQLGYVPGVGTKPFGEETYGGIVIGIYNNADKFDVAGQQSIADGIFSTYLITPEISRHDNYFLTENSKIKFSQDEDGNYFSAPGGGTEGKKIIIMDPDDPTKPFRAKDADNLTQEEWDYLNSQGASSSGSYDNLQGSAWILDSYSFEDTGETAESGKTVSENSAVMNNFVKASNLSMFRRFDSLHVSNLNWTEAGGRGHGGADSALMGELRENLWGDVWHGKFDAKAGYTRNTNQSYNGVQLGYDKLLNKNFYNGKVYTGFYVSKIDGKSTTFSGSGEQDSYGVGIYSSWVGNKGHFIDLGVNAAKVKNDYHFSGNTGAGSIGNVKGENNIWAYGFGAQYGKRNELSANWFWEPSISMYVGRVEQNDYTLSNGLGVYESAYNTAIGKLGVKAGRNIGDKGNIYAGVSWGHEFAGGQKLHQTYGTQNRLLETVGSNDSWWEWNVGGKVKISSNGTFNLDFIKTAGSEVGNEWSINGGLNFSWGGFGSGAEKTAAFNGSLAPVGTGFEKAQSPTVVVGQAAKIGNIRLPQMQSQQEFISAAGSDSHVYELGDGSSRVVRDDTAAVSGSMADGMGEFELGGLTVEAKRPEWEKNLSPGQVSVIYPAQFEGEQKNLPELLDRVPGLFIQRVNGAGHYTVARVRGSTAAQVSVYVDGVQMNLTGDAAVNLSAIPADNIERIEVYRGYVPARFAGAPLGGVINIVTKKPNEGHGHITQGIKSYGGYSSTYEYSMPLGSGSLLATYGRDIWQGDFDYIYPQYDVNTKADKTFKRRSNGYQNNNAMLKWQDEHWTVKGVWKKMHEGLARAITRKEAARDADYNYLDNDMDINYKELLIGRRDTIGNLDLGWHIAYMNSKKTFINTGGYRLIHDSINGTLPNGVYKKFENNYLPGELWGTWHSKKWNGNLNMAMKMGSNHLLELNADYTRETMDCNGNRWDLTQEQIDGQTGATYTRRKMLSRYNNHEYHLTLQDTITLNDDGDFKLTPVLRADKVEMEGLGPMGDGDSRWRYSGGVALQKQINDHWSFKSTWGTYNRHPNFYEIFGDGGFIGQNYGFTTGGYVGKGMWENGKQFDFSLNWQGRLAQADTDTILTYYNRKAKNQMVLLTPRGGDGLSSYAPMNSVDVYGVELAHNMKWQRLNLALAATWQKSKDTSGTFTHNWGQTGGKSFVPEWVVSARVDYLLPGDKLNVFGEYRYTDNEVLRGDNSGGDGAIDVRDSYSIVDLGVKYKFDKKWRLSAGVNDVFDKGKEVFITTGMYYGPRTSSFYPLPGRMYYTTLEYSF